MPGYTHQYSFLAITVHYVDCDWQLVEKFLPFTDTTDHSGAGMAEIVQSTLEQFGIVERLGCATMDNASNNDTLMSSLAETLESYFIRGAAKVPKVWSPLESRIRYLPHILNLAENAFLKSLGEGDDIVNNDEIPDISPSTLLKRLHFIAKKLRSSPQQRKKFLGQCDLANIEKLLLILDVVTCWNSTYYMIERELKVRHGLKDWLSTDHQIEKLKLGMMQFTEDEWETLQQICAHLEKFEERRS
jgi:hypothetical protein